MKQSFAEAETAKQSVEHLFDTSASGQPVERSASGAEVLGNQDEIIGACSDGERIAGVGEVGRLAPVERKRVLAGHERARQPADLDQQSI